jgi:hypothetical protein
MPLPARKGNEMGCDIHAVFQKRTDAGWEDVPTTWDEGRHYFLFSVLAGVRNGFGFAGTPTYDPVKPISEPRGLPADFAMDDEAHPVASVDLLGWHARYHQDDEPIERWMGDHSHSWLTADEILAYEKAGGQRAVERTGILSLEAYREWDKVSQPSAWCGGVFGQRNPRQHAQRDWRAHNPCQREVDSLATGRDRLLLR